MPMLRRYLQTIYLVWIFASPVGSAFAQTVPGAVDRYFTTSDGVRLHYLEAGPISAPNLVFYTKDQNGKIHSRRDMGVFFIPMTGKMTSTPDQAPATPS
jgi:hypothetical protein